eukprot:2621029-Amphidinium_carterae.1
MELNASARYHVHRFAQVVSRQQLARREEYHIVTIVCMTPKTLVLSVYLGHADVARQRTSLDLRGTEASSTCNAGYGAA